MKAFDGLELRLHQFGSSHHPGVLMLHGLGQTGQAWHGAARTIAALGYHVVCPDFRGHGGSDWSPSGTYYLTDFLQDVRDQLGLFADPPVVVGASMGGLLGLLAEAESPQALCRALVLVDITPRWERQGVERILAFMRAAPQGFDSLDAAAEAIASHLPHRSEQRASRRLQRMLVEKADGRWYWHWDPQLLDQIESQSEHYPQRLLAAARLLTQPVLLVSGQHSDVVSSETIDEFLEAVPHARHVDIARATHMVAGDNNDAFNQAVMRFLADLPGLASKQAEPSPVSA